MFTGKDAIDFLSSDINQNDYKESSHWKKYHSNFRFTGNGFEGLKGFGGNRKPYNFFLHRFEKFLQSPYRKMGNSDFSHLDKLAEQISLVHNKNYDLDLLRQALTLSFLRKKIPKLKNRNLTCCVIGDGFSSMSTLLLASNSTSKLIIVNLTKTLLVDLWYLKLWMGNQEFQRNVDLVTNKEDLNIALKKSNKLIHGEKHVIAIRAIDHQLLKDCPIDLAINIVSMQEMNPDIINEYFNDLRESNNNNELFFYCCNREKKILPDGTETNFFEYPWNQEDKILIDELTPWHQMYYTLKPPFYRKYDGPIRHRLIVMKKKENIYD